MGLLTFFAGAGGGVSTNAWQFTSSSGQLDMGVGAPLLDVDGFAISFWIYLPSGFKGGAFNVTNMFDSAGSGTVFACYYDANYLILVVADPNSGVLGANQAGMQLGDGTSGGDIFGALTPNAWHHVAVEWQSANFQSGSYTSMALDGTRYSTLMSSPQIQHVSSPLLNTRASSTVHWTFGKPQDSGSLGLSGMAIANPALWIRYNDNRTTTPILTDADLTNLAAGYPAQVVESLTYTDYGNRTLTNNAVMVDAFPIAGTTTESGFLYAGTSGSYGLQFTHSNASIVAGPSLYPPYLYTASLTRTRVHPSGKSAAVVEWANDLLAGPSDVALTFTDSDPSHDTWTPPGPLPAGPGGTVTVPLAVSSGVTPGGRTVAVTNAANLLPASLPYTIGPTEIQFATGFPRFESRGANATTGAGTGNLLFGRLQKTDGSPVAISGVDLTAGGTVTVAGTYGTRVIPLSDFGSVAFDGLSDDFWCPLIRTAAVLIDDGASGCTLTGTGWSASSYSTPSDVVSDGLTKTNAVYSQVHYSGTTSDTATYTFTSLPYCGSSPFGNQWQVEVILRDNSTGQVSGASAGGPYCPGNSLLSGGSPTTQARYRVSGDGGTTHTDFTVDQTANGTAQVPTDAIDSNRYFAGGSEGSGIYRTTRVGTPIAVNSSGTLTVTISNQAGSGYLVVDAVIARFVPLLLQPGDTVTLTAPDSMFTCSVAGTPTVGGNDNQYNPGTFLDTTGVIDGTSGNGQAGAWSDAALMPFDAGRARTLALGFNATDLNYNTQYWANRLRVAYPSPNSYWRPGAGTSLSDLTFAGDGSGRLIALTSGKVAETTLANASTYNGVDNCGYGEWPAPSRVFTLNLKWTNAAANFTVGLVDIATGGALVTPTTFTGVTSGQLTFTYPQPVNVPNFKVTITAGTSGANSVPQDLWIGAGDTPTTTTTETNPGVLALWTQASPVPQRWMWTYPTIDHAYGQPADYTPDPGVGHEAVNYNSWNVTSVLIDAIERVDTNRGTDADGLMGASTFYSASNPNGIFAAGAAYHCLFKFTYSNASSYDFVPGQQVRIVSDNSTDNTNLTRLETNGGSGGSGTPGVGMSVRNDPTICRIIKVVKGTGGTPTVAYVVCGANDTYTADGIPLTMAAASFTAAGNVYAQSANYGAPSFETSVRMTAEAGNAYWVNFQFGELLDPASAAINYKIDYICAHTPPGTRIYCEFGNEPWNSISANQTGDLCLYFFAGVTGSGGDVNVTYGYWAAQCLYKALQRCVHNGRGADFVPVLNTNGNNFGGQLDGMAAGAAAAGFTATSAFPNLLVAINGYLTNDTSAGIGGTWGSYKYGPMGQANYPTNTGIPPANAYDWLDPEARVTLYAWHLLQRGKPAYQAADVAGLVGTAKGRGYTSAFAGAYEASYQSFGSSTWTRTDVEFLAFAHLEASILPRARTFALSAYQNFYEPVYPGGPVVYYTDVGIDFIDSAAGWQVSTYPGQPAGDGTLAGITTTNPGLYGQTKSQLAGAIAYYNTPAPTPTPTPSSTTVAPTMGMPPNIVYAG